MLSIIIALVVFILFELMTSIKHNSLWRYIFLTPAIFIVGVSIWIYSDITRNPNSHTLLPFELLIWLGIAISAHVFLVIVKAFINISASSEKTT
jgi:hypothetical protein